MSENKQILSTRSSTHARQVFNNSIQPPIFIVGIPRSGSTLWSNLFRKRSDVVVYSEMHFMALWRKDFKSLLKDEIGDLSENRNVEKLVSLVVQPFGTKALEHGRFFWKELAKIDSEEFRGALYRRIISSERTIGEIFKIIIEETTRYRGYNRCIVKFPVHPAHLNRLVEWLPEAKILHISRDPRAIAISKTNDPGGARRIINRHPYLRPLIEFSAKWFAVAQYWMASRAHARLKHHTNYRLFQYEDLLLEPVRTIHEVCEFCELDFEEGMLNPDEGQASSVIGVKTSGFDPSRISNWRRVATPFDVRAIGFVTKGSMKRFGYKPDHY